MCARRGRAGGCAWEEGGMRVGGGVASGGSRMQGGQEGVCK